MEYKNVDDSDASAAAKSKDGDDKNEAISFPEGEEVGGIDFSRLLKRKPTLAKELKMLREELGEAMSGQSQEMKVRFL